MGWPSQVPFSVKVTVMLVLLTMAVAVTSDGPAPFGNVYVVCATPLEAVWVDGVPIMPLTAVQVTVIPAIPLPYRSVMLAARASPSWVVPAAGWLFPANTLNAVATSALAVT